MIQTFTIDDVKKIRKAVANADYIRNANRRKDPLVNGFDIIEVDAPHHYNQRADTDRMRGGAVSKYPLLEDADLDLLPVIDVAKQDCLLFYWTTGPKLERSVETIRRWGFDYKTFAWVWVKTNKGKRETWVKLYEMQECALKLEEAVNKAALRPFCEFIQAKEFFGNGFYSKANAEICLLAKRGVGMKPVRDDVSSIIIAPVREHSRKPWEAHYRVNAQYPDLDKLELFARRQEPGWTCLGNDLDGMDIRDSLPQLKEKLKKEESMDSRPNEKSLRNLHIWQKFIAGKGLGTLATEYGMTKTTIRKLIFSQADKLKCHGDTLEEIRQVYESNNIA